MGRPAPSDINPVMPKKGPPSSGSPGFPFFGRPASIDMRGGRKTPPGYAVGPADGLVPYPDDPRLGEQKIDYGDKPYRVRKPYTPTGGGGKQGPVKPVTGEEPKGFPIGPKKPNKKPFRIPPDFVCPDPEMGILMADGSQKKAGDLIVGNLIKTYHEKSFELGDYEVEHVDIINDVEKIKLIFDKNTIICSLSHKLHVNDFWKEAKDMVVDDVVSDNKLVAVERVENGDVVQITVKDAHTYICEGLLSHNKTPRIDPDTGEIIPYDKPFPRRDGRGKRVGRRVLPRPPIDDFGPAPYPRPEREVPLPKEKDTSPRGPAPFAPDEKKMVKDRFFERVFDKADERKQQRSMEKEERREVRKSRRDERRSIRGESGEIDVGGEIDINAERGGRRRRRRRDFTRRRSRMEGRRSREERAAFRDRYVSTLGGGFFS